MADEDINKGGDSTDKPTSIVASLVAKNSSQDSSTDDKLDDENIDDKEIHSDDDSGDGHTDSGNENLITEEMAKLAGIHKSFVGKPLSELGKAMNELRNYGTQTNQRLINLETNFNELKGQLTQQQAQKAEAQAAAQVKDELGPMPNSFDEPEKFAAWLEAKILKAIEDSGKKLSEKFENDPTLKQAQELAAKETEKVTLSLLQEGLPKEVDAGKVIDAWFEENKDDYQKLVDSGIYLNKPEKFVRDVVNWYKALSFDDLKNKKESDIMKKIHQKTKENLQKAGSVTKTLKGSQPRSESTETKSIAGKIKEKLQRQNSLREGAA